MIRWWYIDDTMIIRWWYDDDTMMIRWWYDDNTMMIWWWYGDDTMMIRWWYGDDTMMIRWSYHHRPEKVGKCRKKKKKWLLNKIKLKKKTSYRKKTKEGGSNHELNHSAINNITINSERNNSKLKTVSVFLNAHVGFHKEATWLVKILTSCVWKERENSRPKVSGNEQYSTGVSCVVHQWATFYFSHFKKKTSFERILSRTQWRHWFGTASSQRLIRWWYDDNTRIIRW